MPVTCPHCSTRYVLPKALLGPGGARVRCPRCREPFVVTAEGDAVPPVVKPAESGAHPSATPSATNGAQSSATPPATDGAHSSATPAATNGAAQNGGMAAAFAGPPPLGTAPLSEHPPTPANEPDHAGPPTIVPATTTRGGPLGEIEKTRLVGGAGTSPRPTTGSSATTAPTTAAPTTAAAATDAPHEPRTPLEVARAVLDELSTHSGEAIAKSRIDGKLFREFGPVIAEAFEFYRRQVGSGADPAPFRIALREKWGVDLDPSHPAGRLS